MEVIHTLGLIALSVSVLWAPGACLLAAITWASRGPIAEWTQQAGVRWALALALSISGIALGWEVATTLGWRVTPLITAALGLGLSSVAFWLEARRGVRLWRQSPCPSVNWALVGLLAVIALAGVTRFLAIRDLAFPPWVDSPHHALIMRLFALTQQVPTSYAPLLDVTPYTYHFGFHTAAVSYGWITGLAPIDTLLVLGQILNALMPLTTYAFAFLLVKDARVALIAAAISGLISIFPGYYLSWGRYTQLTGLLILTPLGGLVVAVLQAGRTANRRAQWGVAMVVGLLVAGLIFTHYRVLAFGLTLGIACLIIERRLDWPVWLAAGLVAVVAAGPWLWHLVMFWVIPRLGDTGSYLAPEGYNDFRWNYFTRTLEQAWWAVAVFGAVAGLARRERAVLVLVGWFALTVVMLNIPGAGTWVVNNESWMISAFIPGSVLAGYAIGLGLDLTRAGEARLIGWLLARPAAPRPLVSAAGWLPTGVLLALAAWALWVGAMAQATIANPVTILGYRADRNALNWMQTHLPSNAVLAVNSWNWQHHIWSARDGGVWIMPELGLRTTIPPVDYAFDPVLNVAVNDWNARWMAITDSNAPATAELLREAGVTHLYFGLREGGLSADMFRGSPNYEVVYDVDGVRIFAVADHWRGVRTEAP